MTLKMQYVWIRCKSFVKMWIDATMSPLVPVKIVLAFFLVLLAPSALFCVWSDGVSSSSGGVDGGFSLRTDTQEEPEVQVHEISSTTEDSGEKVAGKEATIEVMQSGSFVGMCYDFSALSFLVDSSDSTAGLMGKGSMEILHDVAIAANLLYPAGTPFISNALDQILCSLCHRGRGSDGCDCSRRYWHCWSEGLEADFEEDAAEIDRRIFVKNEGSYSFVLKGGTFRDSRQVVYGDDSVTYWIVARNPM